MLAGEALPTPPCPQARCPGEPCQPSGGSDRLWLRRSRRGAARGGGRGAVRAAAAEPAAPESAAVGSEASPCPAPAPRGVESSDRAARRLPAALGFRHKQQRGSKKTASSVRSGNVGPATAREGRHLRGGGACLPTYKTTSQPHPPRARSASSVGLCSVLLSPPPQRHRLRPLGCGVCPRRLAAPRGRLDAWGRWQGSPRRQDGLSSPLVGGRGCRREGGHVERA